MVSPTPRGYRSATEYRFAEEQTDAIIRVAAYHRRDFSLSVIWFPSREHTHVRRSISTPFERTSNIGLGSLDRLPLELMHSTLVYLDMQSVFKFRQVNLRSRQIVDSIRQYQVVVSHGLNLLCALLRTHIAAHVSLFDFYHALCTRACAICNEFAGFISLLTWERCCFKCLRQAPQMEVRPVAALRRQFHLTRAELRKMRSFKTLPGIYSMAESVHKSRIAIASVHQAASVAERRQHTVAQGVPHSSARDRKFNFMGSCALPYYDRLTGNVERGISCAGCQLALEKDIIGTRAEDWAFEARDKVYGKREFLEHFRWCEQAQLLWKSSGEGSRLPTELPEGARRGGYFKKRE
ncbi:hypothetical protein VTK73DRAFT_8671 [Phialemonium thermophilum]|uniref:F-box domain-containing protein n=1 Tax=Phialemonium thermophilum TaxID=223376 RepID=A0ABR3XNT8_9PEZI